MADVRRFIPKAERLRAEQAREARQQILDLALTEDILVALSRHESSGRITDWHFNMISPEQCLKVWDAIRELPSRKRPQQTRHLFDLVLTHLEPNTGLVTLTREELAEMIGTSPANVSRMMGTLEELNVVRRERRKVPGMRGPGTARYRINPHVGWNGELERRREVARHRQDGLPLTVIEGGGGDA